MVLELESFEARRAFKLAQIGTVSVICHVSLQLGQVGKLFGAHSARLNEGKLITIQNPQIQLLPSLCFQDAPLWHDVLKSPSWEKSGHNCK